MSNGKNQQERRKHKRFKACSGVFAVNSNFGLIANISLGGLAFDYVEREPWTKSSVDKGALFGEDDMWIDEMPIEYISKSKTEKNTPSKSAVIKKRRVIFAELSPYKRELVKKFIHINAKEAQKAGKC